MRAGPKSALQMFSTAMTMFERSCNALMSNGTALAAVEVHTLPTTQHLSLLVRSHWPEAKLCCQC